MKQSTPINAKLLAHWRKAQGKINYGPKMNVDLYRRLIALMDEDLFRRLVAAMMDEILERNENQAEREDKQRRAEQESRSWESDEVRRMPLAGRLVDLVPVVWPWDGNRYFVALDAGDRYEIYHYEEGVLCRADEFTREFNRNTILALALERLFDNAKVEIAELERIYNMPPEKEN